MIHYLPLLQALSAQQIKVGAGLGGTGRREGAAEKKQLRWCSSRTYQQAEAGDGGEGVGHGGAGEGQLAEVADVHDGDHLDDVLQQRAGDHGPRQAQLLRHLLARAQAAVGPARGEERLLHAARLRHGCLSSILASLVSVAVLRMSWELSD